MLNDLRYRLRALVRRGSVERELDEEVRFHFELQVERSMESGLSRAEAERRARLDVGGIDQIKEQCRDVHGVHLIETLGRDISFGMRILRRNPGFAVVSLLLLALGIGANTAIFSLVNSVLINPYQFPEPERIVNVEVRHKGRSLGAGYRDFLDWREQNRVFEEMAIIPTVLSNARLIEANRSERINVGFTTHGFFRVLGVAPVVGRVFTAGEDFPGGPPLAILTHAAWQRRFGGAQDVLGRTMTCNDIPYTIVGVLPRGFAFSGIPTCEFFSALRESPARDRFQHQYGVVARLKPGVALERAQAEIDAIALRLEQAHPHTNAGCRVRLTLLGDSLANEAGKPVLILFSVVLVVLLLACANVAGLQLARASARGGEMAMRASLGAGRLRLAAQVMTESLLLALCGGGLGLLFAQWLIAVLRSVTPPEAALDASLRVDALVLWFTFGISVVAGIVFGLAPAFYGSRSDLNSIIKGGAGIRGCARSRSRFMSSLIAGEAALSLVLLIAAGLLIKDLLSALHVETGFRAEGVLTFGLDAPGGQRRSENARVQLYRDVLDRLRRMPGVESAAAVDSLPMSGNFTGHAFRVEGDGAASRSLNKDGGVVPEWLDRVVQYNGSTPGFFRSMAIPILRGRDFDGGDTASSPPVAIINDAIAKQFFHGRDPIGMRFLDEYDRTWRTIIGVVGSYKGLGPTKPPGPAVFRPLAQTGFGAPSIVVRASGDPGSAAGLIERMVRSLNPDVFVVNMRAMKEVVANSLRQSTLIARFMAGFSLFSLLLAAVGIYGIVSYSVRNRAREIGLRMALGASSRDIMGSMLGQSVRLSLAGLMVGIPLALGVSGVLASMLLGVDPRDLSVFITASAVVVLVSLTAGYLPARRAAKVDPIQVLRE